MKKMVSHRLLIANPANDIAEKVKEMDQETRDHLVYMFHSSINLQMHGYDAPQMEYAIHPYTGSRWGGTFRHDFKQEAGQVITMARIAPDGKSILVAKGTVVCGVGEKLEGCTQGLAFTVKTTGISIRNSRISVTIVRWSLDYFDQVVALGELLGLDVCYCMMTVESFEENLKQNNEKCDVLIQEILSTAGNLKLHELLYRYLLHKFMLFDLLEELSGQDRKNKSVDEILSVDILELAQQSVETIAHLQKGGLKFKDHSGTCGSCLRQ